MPGTIVSTTSPMSRIIAGWRNVGDTARRRASPWDSRFYGAVVKLQTTLPASALPAISLAPVVSVAV